MYIHFKFLSFLLLLSASPSLSLPSLSSSMCNPLSCSWCSVQSSCLPLGTCCVSTPTCCSDLSITSLPSCLRRQCRTQSKPHPSPHPMNTIIGSAFGIILGVTFIILFMLVGVGVVIGFLVWKNFVKMYLVKRGFKLRIGGDRR